MKVGVMRTKLSCVRPMAARPAARLMRDRGRIQVVRGTLYEDEPAMLRVRADVVDLHRHLVFSTFYPGAKVLVGRAAQRDAEQQAAFLYLVADREHGQAGPAGVREAAHTAR